MRRHVTVNTRRGPGLLMTAAVVGGTTAVVSGSMQKKAAQQQQAAAQQQQMADMQTQQAQLAAQQEALAQKQAAAAQPAAAPQAPNTPAAGSLDDQLVQIQKLSVMKDQGLITEEEFQAKKKQILGL